MKNWLVSLGLLCSSATFAADPGEYGNWAQWRGPDRTGLSKETGLLKEWPTAGPTQVWKIEGLGDGYSTPSFSDGKIYLLGTKGKDEFLIALNQKDGSKIGDVKIGTVTGGYGAPKSTPTIDNGYAYAVSSNGNFVCVDTATLKIKWEKDFKKVFGGQMGGWAYTESPLIDGDLVLATPGGDTATIVAMKKTDGEVVWKSPITELDGKKLKKDFSRAGYSSIIKADVGGTTQYIQFLNGGVVGISAKEGKLLWHYDEPANGTANCSTPLFKDNAVFAASAYGTGGGRANLTKSDDGFKAEPKYFIKKLQNHHGGMVLVGDYVYGTGGGSLMCVDFKTGDVMWDERSVGKGSITYADGMLYVRGENGKVALVEANPKKYVEKGQFSQPDRSKQAAWPYPVVVGGKLYLRDWDVMLCYDLKK
ncbi:outer membrane protein assembly factor BamB family protein [Zavarzinella formosa]|uniref:outer membrane protein assembly factor BamB family protein n=1 Tax=Zavarzinella formosa TaxID=360055 RepID=UPI0003066543|nr:PQQ-binding-like beta-propeller repeat protein [Zavarzinella formosa]